MSNATLVRLSELLTKDGFFPATVSDTTLEFKFQGGHYLFITDPIDQNFIQLAFPNAWIAKNADEIHALTSAAMHVNANLKFVKVVILDPHVHLLIESCANTPDDFFKFLTRYLGVLQSAANMLWKRISAQTE